MLAGERRTQAFPPGGARSREARPTGTEPTPPLIRYLPLGAAREPETWQRVLDATAALGFDTVCLPRQAAGGDPGDSTHAPFEPEALAARTDAAAAAGISVMLDIAAGALDDPARLGETVKRLTGAGVSAFRCLDPTAIAADAWRTAITGAAAPSAAGAPAFYAWTPGIAWSALPGLAAAGFSGAFSSAAWWDERSAWLVEEHELLARLGTVIAFPEPPDGARRSIMAERAGRHPESAARRALALAVATGGGLMVPMGFERGAERSLDRLGTPEAALAGPLDLDADLAAANALARSLAGAGSRLRLVTPPGSRPTAILRTPTGDPAGADRAAMVLLDPDGGAAEVAHLLDPVPWRAGAAFVLDASQAALAPLAPGEIRIVPLRPASPVAAAAGRDPVAAAALPRVAIEGITPEIDGGRFPAKTVAGHAVVVEADIFADGHDRLGAELLWRPVDAEAWRRVPMRIVTNDRWRAAFTPDRVGRHVFAVEAWVDGFASFHHGLEAKVAAGRDVALEVEEGRAMLAAASTRGESEAAAVLTAIAAVEAAEGTAAKAVVLLEEATVAAMAVAEEHFFCARSAELPVTVDRPKALFSSWYELFPRSETDDPARHGTFRDVIRRLPAIAAMGFDVLYFPPIHPIGMKNRKGRNNSLTAGPDDVGSPYAIGAAEGGHDALHPALGTIDDFRALRDAAAGEGLELAIDFAIQCAPDHPWLTEHPDWFRHRPDGSIAYAENPPKRYEDIVNVDFYAAGAVPGLWEGLRDVVLFWAGEGVRIFRVDNPHTKPLPFWEWMIGSVQDRYPDAIFLSEAFTKPKMMNRLAKVGFTQSYTYFTWRNTKYELEQYLTELTTTDAKDFFRPNFFVNTPDINPVFLQTSGRPGFLIRAALATTLAGSWGMYSGFEICEAAPLPGREEYLDSEKYEIRVRDWAAPGNIVAEIALLNRLRRTFPALGTHLGVTFYPTGDEAMMLYGKRLPGADDMVLVAVCLDPAQPHDTAFELPLWEWKLPDDGALAAEDLVTGNRFVWRGKNQRLRLDPAVMPFALWHLAPLAGE